MRAALALLLLGACWRGPTAPTERDPRAALATEPLSGTVLVSERAMLFATAAAAESSRPPEISDPVTMHVIADHGDIVELSTQLGARAGEDCVRGWQPAYTLRVFVRRRALVPRTTEAIARTFPDGTAFAIDRGAPVRLGAHPTWFDDVLRATGATPPARLAYAIGPVATTPLPAPGSELVACDAMSMFREPLAGGFDTFEPACLHPDEYRDPEVVPPVTMSLGGRSIADMSGSAATVYRVRDEFVLDVPGTCGRIRARASRPNEMMAMALLTGLEQGSSAVSVRPGPVYWPDGARAGTYDGEEMQVEAAHLEEVGGLSCIEVDRVASRVCWKTRDVKRTH